MSLLPITGNPSAAEILPTLTIVDIPAAPHLITVAARTGTDVELRIAAFDVATEQWFPAAAGFAVTVLVHTLDATTGRPRNLPRYVIYGPSQKGYGRQTRYDSLPLSHA